MQALKTVALLVRFPSYVAAEHKKHIVMQQSSFSEVDRFRSRFGLANQSPTAELVGRNGRIVQSNTQNLIFEKAPVVCLQVYRYWFHFIDVRGE